ncbi:hypothetical protein M011DRAFT_22770 [Sporormia fimetaria CBS 119925]|uniref:Uncharacterized protein n=1 Tax=Sporormia fimetaria CBS 119925 TaxID=1340428 RepID=A0A6A6VFF8_9PLEO|nr:hypothetical protein M011DRAFT_22770 [Sporormia fimetaria CBS 119925]
MKEYGVQMLREASELVHLSRRLKGRLAVGKVERCVTGETSPARSGAGGSISRQPSYTVSCAASTGAQAKALLCSTPETGWRWIRISRVKPQQRAMRPAGAASRSSDCGSEGALESGARGIQKGDLGARLSEGGQGGRW